MPLESHQGNGGHITVIQFLKKEKTRPSGLVVIKGSIELIEKELALLKEEIVLVTDPHGVVFISNVREWLYKVIWKISSEEEPQIAKSRQFGKRAQGVDRYGTERG